ncbi:hypothetical protein Thein_0692 [Thermodesulfatator indicus DSM 15286]|uniref:Glycosyltransferase 2-like domain-containing protein n=1 Tax=Thermodesulfatator indicus (strain DSM 15286 / JCM 11887 / CIR29812) TaxID=667014 RepID=F8AC17_THEID|nr:glycosyltransferase [Thermodesulfatator indicus]AEH44572.1 hypothetical protein Thein_0692 [Thermodesulfatator indicus DSM 15286]
MKVSGFTFLRNAEMLGYPFVQSIKSILPIVDEFIVALGPCEDNTEIKLKEIDTPKLKIIHTQWNENMRTKGFVYGQQKSIALFNCTGDWAFYLEADEVIHEDDLPKIKRAMQKYLNDPDVEALAFDYIHFYGNKNTYIWSPGWYRKEVRIIKNNLFVWAPKGLFFLVVNNYKRGRYPKAAMTGAKIYHYGWIRSEEQMNLKLQKVEKYWGKEYKEKKYDKIDPKILREFKGKHPKVIEDWLPPAEGIFRADPNYKLTWREKKHRVLLFFEKLFNLDFSKKHFKLVK